MVDWFIYLALIEWKLATVHTNIYKVIYGCNSIYFPWSIEVQKYLHGHWILYLIIRILCYPKKKYRTLDKIAPQVSHLCKRNSWNMYYGCRIRLRTWVNFTVRRAYAKYRPVSVFKSIAICLQSVAPRKLNGKKINSAPIPNIIHLSILICYTILSFILSST